MHIASVAAGNVYGVAKGADIISVRVLDCNGAGTVSQTAAGKCSPSSLLQYCAVIDVKGRHVVVMRE